MMKTYTKEKAVVFNEKVEFFYKRERNAANGCPRFRVWALDPETNAVYEFIAKGYGPTVAALVSEFLEKEAEKNEVLQSEF